MWILDPGRNTLRAAITTEHARLADYLWCVALRESPDGWGSDIADITACLTKSRPWIGPASASSAPAGQ